MVIACCVSEKAYITSLLCRYSLLKNSREYAPHYVCFQLMLQKSEPCLGAVELSMKASVHVVDSMEHSELAIM
jgi:hypothetical protein